MIKKRSEARKLFKAGVALTLFVAGNRAKSWQYTTLKLEGKDTPLIRAPGANRWSELVPVQDTDLANLNPHGLAAYTLAVVLLRYLAGEVKLTDGMVLVETAYCGACGKPLTAPDSVAEGLGPECGERGQARKARREAKAQAVRDFQANMTARYQV